MRELALKGRKGRASERFGWCARAGGSIVPLANADDATHAASGAVSGPASDDRRRRRRQLIILTSFCLPLLSVKSQVS